MSTEPDRVLHISDVHFGVEDRRALHAFAEAVGDVRPHAIVCTGDLTQRARHSQYAAAQEWFSSFDVPVMLAPGNHDMPYYNMVERFRRPYARFDVLNAAAGSAIELKHAVIVPLDTNVTALLHVTRAVLPGMLERRRGHIVQMSSIAALYPLYTALYGASKGAVHLLSQNLRMDLKGSGVRHTEICPGRVRTEFFMTAIDDDA